MLFYPAVQILPSGFVVNTWVNSANASGLIDFESIEEDFSGNQEVGSYQFDITDSAVTAAYIKDMAYVRVQDAEGGRFKGFITSRTPVVMGGARKIHVEATGIEYLLDNIVVLQNTRYAGESDATRIMYLLATYGGQGLFNDSFGSTDTSKIQVLNASMPKQKFRYMTLRQAIEAVLGVASTTSNYYIDHLGRLHTFDQSHPDIVTSAPYVIRVGTPGGGEISPEDMVIEYDSTDLKNFYYVRAKYRSADVPVSDANSISLYGRRTAIVDAPDADTSTKATAVGNAALLDNAAPKVRGSFTVRTPYTDGWRVGQLVTFYSTVHGLNGAQSRIVNIAGKYESGSGYRVMEIKFGGDRLRLRSGSTTVGTTTSTG